MKINSSRSSVACLGAVLLVATAPAALADTAFLSYTLQNSLVVTATFTGTLAGDLFTVTSTDALAFGGVSYSPAAFPLVESVDEVFGGFGPDVPILSLSGTYLDIIVANLGVNDGFSLSVGSDFASFIGFDNFNSGPSFGSAIEPFVLDNYSLTVVTSSVPEASTWAAGGALLLAAGGTWFRSRRQA